MTTSLDDQAPEDSTGAPEQMSSTRGMFPLGPVSERLFNYILMVLVKWWEDESSGGRPNQYNCADRESNRRHPDYGLDANLV